MLTSVDEIRMMPGLSCTANAPTAWLNVIVRAADRAVKAYLKRDIELSSYIEYHDGDNQRDIICRQFPILKGQTTITASSNGVVLPTATINVSSTSGFHPGDADREEPSICVQVSNTSYTRVRYTGVTATTFTGCYGGEGTMTTGYTVTSPVVNYDPNGYFGQGSDPFDDGTIVPMGSNFVVLIDDRYGRDSYAGLLRRIGGSGAAFPGFYPEMIYSGKLAARRLPIWPRGDGCLRVCYNAGYETDDIPADIRAAATMLGAYMIRNQPSGAALASENLAGYSYSIFSQSNEVPEIGAIARTLARYRETSW